MYHIPSHQQPISPNGLLLSLTCVQPTFTHLEHLITLLLPTFTLNFTLTYIHPQLYFYLHSLSTLLLPTFTLNFISQTQRLSHQRTQLCPLSQPQVLSHQRTQLCPLSQPQVLSHQRTQLCLLCQPKVLFNLKITVGLSQTCHPLHAPVPAFSQAHLSHHTIHIYIKQSWRHHTALS